MTGTCYYSLASSEWADHSESPTASGRRCETCTELVEDLMDTIVGTKMNSCSFQLVYLSTESTALDSTETHLPQARTGAPRAIAGTPAGEWDTPASRDGAKWEELSAPSG